MGINHSGDFDLLVKMAKTALSCGVDYVKLQTRTPELCVPQNQWQQPREWFDGTPLTYIEYKNRMELSQAQLDAFNSIFKGRWFSSVWDVPSIYRLSRYNLPILKIPSAKIVDLELIRVASADTNTIMISTGMSTKEEIASAVFACNSPETIIMSCHSAYPSPDNEVDLNRIVVLRDMIVGDSFKFGFSSHCTSPYPAIYSVFSGAEYIEVHFTLDRATQGTDHAASLEPAGLRLISRELERISKLFGDGGIRVYESELPALRKLRGA